MFYIRLPGSFFLKIQREFLLNQQELIPIPFPFSGLKMGNSKKKDGMVLWCILFSFYDYAYWQST